MTVDDHPLSVLQALLDQAGAHGIRPVVDCEADIPKGPTFTRLTLDDSKPVKDAVQAVICNANASVAGRDYAWSMSLHWGTYYDRRFPAFTSVVMHAPSRTDASHPQPAVQGPHVMPRMIDWDHPVAAGEGQPFTGQPRFEYTGVSLRVAKGSALVAPIADDGTCTSGAFAAVIRVTGPEDAAADYLKQFADNRYAPNGDTTLSGGGVLTRASEAGGGDITLTRITADGTRWLLIQRCDD